MMANCDNCSQKCHQAEMAHQIALGRMYATKELVRLIKKIDAGELVEVVQCKDCKHSNAECHKDGLRYCMRGIKADDYNETGYIYPIEEVVRDVDFCSYGERRSDNVHQDARFTSDC